MKIHELKCGLSFYNRLSPEGKTAEIRLNDRDYQVKDYLVLYPHREGETDRLLVPQGFYMAQITDIVTAEEFPRGLQEGYVMLSMRSVGGHEGRAVREMLTLQRWKAGAIKCESQWDPQIVGKLLGLDIGDDIRVKLEPKIRELNKELIKVRKQLDFYLTRDFNERATPEGCKRQLERGFPEP